MSHIPIYVYFVFLLILWLGFSASVPRTIRLERLVLLPAIMLVLGLRGLINLFPSIGPVAVLAGVCGLALGLFLGDRHARVWVVSINRARRQLSIPGDRTMPVLLLSTFAFEFVLHYAIESGQVSPDDPWISAGAAALWGLFAGMLAGRNVHLARRYLRAETLGAIGGETPSTRA